MNYIISGLINCSIYTFDISSLDITSNESLLTTLNNVIPLWPNPPTSFTANWISQGTNILLNWSEPNPICDPPDTYSIYYSTDNITFTEIPNIPYSSNSYNFLFISYGTYYFYMKSVKGAKMSTPTSTETVNAELFIVSGGSFSTTSTTNGSIITYNIVVTNSLATTLTFNILPDSNYCNFQLVGAGGGGGGLWSYIISPSFPVYSGGGGGGGGNLLINNFTVDTNTYTISVGSGGSGGIFNDPTIEDDNTNQPGKEGGSTSIIGTGINCVANGGSGGNKGQNGIRADGVSGGNVTINILTDGISNYGSGGNGGQGNITSDYTSGTNGQNGYFYNNEGLSYSQSTSYPTFYRPNNLYTPESVTLTEWFQVSGGGGGANSNVSNNFITYQGGSGRGSGGLNGGNYPTGSLLETDPNTPYPSFGGGGGGGGIATAGFKGGDGLAVIWFSYTIL